MNNNDVQLWKLSSQANLDAMNSNDSRAAIESDQIISGDHLVAVHAEALQDFAEIERLILGGIRFIRNLKKSFSGTAADLGSGVGTGATIISQLPEIDKVYAVEYSQQFVYKIMPLVFEHFHAEESKIIPVIGDFNQLFLEDGSLSLIVEIDSYHHSEDLNHTLAESRRVLRPGGVIISVDRSWSDSYSREELEAKLDIEYSAARKALYGIPPEKKYCRRDNGEHEYTDHDWETFYRNNGFEVFIFSQVHPPALNTLLFGKLPTFNLSIDFSAFLSRLGFHRLPIYGFNPTRKLFVAIKK